MRVKVDEDLPGEIATMLRAAAGVVLFRHPRESRSGYVQLADVFLRQFRLAAAAGATIVVSPSSIRVHRSAER